MEYDGSCPEPMKALENVKVDKSKQKSIKNQLIKRDLLGSHNALWNKQKMLGQAQKTYHN